jgi:hypothetical protein
MSISLCLEHCPARVFVGSAQTPDRLIIQIECAGPEGCGKRTTLMGGVEGEADMPSATAELAGQIAPVNPELITHAPTHEFPCYGMKLSSLSALLDGHQT